jgi:hypothetical protein
MRFRQQVKGRGGRARQVAERPVRASGALSGDPVYFSGEPGENPGGPHRVKREQSHRGAERPGNRLVGRDPRGLARRASGRRRGNSKHDRMMRPADSTSPAATCHGGKARQARCFRPHDPGRAQQRAPLPPGGLPLGGGRGPRIGFGVKLSQEPVIPNDSGRLSRRHVPLDFRAGGGRQAGRDQSRRP